MGRNFECFFNLWHAQAFETSAIDIYYDESPMHSHFHNTYMHSEPKFYYRNLLVEC